MKPPKGRAIITWLAGIAVLAAVAAAALYLRNQPAPGLPEVDLSAMETRVATRIRRFQTAVNSDPSDARAWAGLAQALHAHDLFDPAITAYAEAMDLQPGDSRWPYLAALAQAESDPGAAVPLFERAVALRPGNAAVYVNFGDLLLRLGRFEEAQQAYEQALGIDGNSTHALYGLAQVAMAADQPGTAVSLLERAEALAPQHGEIHTLLAQAYQRLGEDGSARRQSILARTWSGTTRAPDPVVQDMESLAVDSQSVVSRGIVLARRGQFEEAEAAFKEALEIRPGNARSYANLGGALAGQGKNEEALEAYRKGLEADPSDVDILNNLGYTLFQLQRLEEAEQRLNQALEIEPGFAPALGNLALVAARRRETDLAIQYLQDALQQDPGLLSARNFLATQFALKGDTVSAVEQWRIVLDINPRDLAALYNLSMTLIARGEHAEAVVWLRRGLQMAPNSSRLVAALAWLLATSPDDSLRNGEEALQLARRLVQSMPNEAQMQDILAAALAETGDFENAVKVMEALVARGGGNPDVMAMRLEAYRGGQPLRVAVTQAASVPVVDPED